MPQVPTGAPGEDPQGGAQRGTGPLKSSFRPRLWDGLSAEGGKEGGSQRVAAPRQALQAWGCERNTHTHTHVHRPVLARTHRSPAGGCPDPADFRAASRVDCRLCCLFPAPLTPAPSVI